MTNLVGRLVRVHSQDYVNYVNVFATKATTGRILLGRLEIDEIVILLDVSDYYFYQVLCKFGAGFVPRGHVNT